MADEESELFRSNAPQERVVAEQSAPKARQPAIAHEGQTRQLQDSNATGTAGQHVLGEVAIGQHESDAAGQFTITPGNADEATQATAATADADEMAAVAPPVDALVMPVIKEDEDAVPWAIAIDLERRIQSLGATTAAVNRELDALEASSKKLAKRMTS